MSTQPEDCVVPGDRLPLEPPNRLMLLGPGVTGHSNDETVIVTRAGRLRHKDNTRWVDSCRKCYVPHKNDLVVGVIVLKRGDSYRVNINSAELAVLSVYAFEGATKRQKPDIQIGDVVYARVLQADDAMDPELVCIDSYYKAGRLGKLSNEGFVFEVRPEFAQKVLNVKNDLLKKLGSKIVYEVAVGVNGKIWVNARSAKDIYYIYKNILLAEMECVERFCKRM